MTVFDLGYSIRYYPKQNGYAELLRPGLNPILEFHKLKVTGISWYQGDHKKWFFREATMTDDILNELLPPDWQLMKYRGFDTMHQLKNWLERR